MGDHRRYGSLNPADAYRRAGALQGFPRPTEVRHKADSGHRGPVDGVVPCLPKMKWAAQRCYCTAHYRIKTIPPHQQVIINI